MGAVDLSFIGEGGSGAGSVGFLLSEHKLSGIETLHARVVDYGESFSPGICLVCIVAFPLKRGVFPQQVLDVVISVVQEVLSPESCIAFGFHGRGNSSLDAREQVSVGHLGQKRIGGLPDGIEEAACPPDVVG